MPKSAIILGATGLTGGLLLKKLLENEGFSSIVVFGRTSCNIKHPKLTEYIVDLFTLEEHIDKFKADVTFCCVGTTKAKTPDKKVYLKVDKGIPVKAANLSKANNIKTFVVISSLGADAGSRIFYNKTKGEMEQEVIKVGLDRTYVLQPSIIRGDRTEPRLFEKIGGAIMGLLSPLLIGDLQKYKPITPEQIVDCMVWLADNDADKTIIPSDEIIEIAAGV